MKIIPRRIFTHVQMGSVASVASMNDIPLYAASKHGILAMVRSHGLHMQQRSEHS